MILNYLKSPRDYCLISDVKSNLCPKQNKRKDKTLKQNMPKTDNPQLETLNFREIECNEPLIFNILAWRIDFYEINWNVNIELCFDRELIRLSSESKETLKRLNSDIHMMIKNLIKVHIQYKENQFLKLKRNLEKFTEKYRERKNIKIVYTHSVEQQIYTVGITTYSVVQKSVLQVFKNEIIDWKFKIAEFDPCDDIKLASVFMSKEIECYEPLIFNILERLKDFYEKDWKVKLELFLDKQLIRISSQSKRPLERLNSSINTMIKKLIKIQIEYKENEFDIVTRKLKEFNYNHRHQKHIRIVYIHFDEENSYKIGLTSYNDSENSDLELLKKEIIDWGFDIVGLTPEYLIIFNNKSNFNGTVKM